MAPKSVLERPLDVRSDYPYDSTALKYRYRQRISELKSYIEAIRNLQLNTTQKHAILGRHTGGVVEDLAGVSIRNRPRQPTPGLLSRISRVSQFET
jgi:hypothetical protein